MSKLFKSIIIMLCALCLSSVVFAESKNEVRGVWVATVLRLDYPKNSTTSASELKTYTDDILDRAYSLGLNTIYLQVRPTADAIYPSKLFPYSKYLTGEQGLAPQDDFDVLQYWVDGAHSRGMQLHAWINPYRITKKEFKDPKPTIDALVDGHPAKLHPEWVVEHHDSNLYFDPGIPEVRALIVNGISEILDNYSVDGIHFDDYFYPGVDFNDEATYSLYGQGMDKSDWRRYNVNELIASVYKVCHDRERPVEFGISPFGIWANSKDMANGSDTAGNSSYSMHYADSLYWIDEEIIDYILPQIYWHIGFDIADYKTLVTWWNTQTKGTNTKLIIGQAAYRLGAENKDSPWYGTDELFRQLKFNRSLGIKDSVYFRMGDFMNDDSLYHRLQFYYDFLDLHQMLLSQNKISQ